MSETNHVVIQLVHDCLVNAAWLVQTLQMNSMSSLSMSLMTMIFILARKCNAKSLTASLTYHTIIIISMIKLDRTSASGGIVSK